MKDLTIFILGHEKEEIKNTCSLIKEKSYLKLVPVNLNDLDLSNYPENYNTKLLSENRFFLCDWNIETEYVGIISYSWPRKFARFNLKMIPDQVLKDIDKNKVIVPARTSPPPIDKNWMELSERCHSGIGVYLEELASFMNYKNWNQKATFWCNTFFCHRDVYFNFLKDWRLMFGYLHLKYQMNFNYDCMKEYTDDKRRPAYLLERATMMHFAERNAASQFLIEQFSAKTINKFI